MHNYELHLVTHDNLSDIPKLIDSVIDTGITTIQLRNKKADKGDLYKIGKAIQKKIKGKNISLIINDHIDLAMALDADGVHLGQTDLPWVIARKILGPNKIIGLSIQSMAHLENALNAAVDYYGVGPIFSTPTKNNIVPMGVPTLTQIVKKTTKPCIAIGGIQPTNVEQLMSSKIRGVAVVSGICQANNPKTAALSYVHALKS